MAAMVVEQRAVDTRPVHAVPDPLPLTLAGMLAAVGPQAINFGISIGGGEAYLLPNVSARGTLHMHWLMTISVILETALVYECGFYLITVAQPFILWIGVAISAFIYRSIGAWQIWLINKRRMPDGFKVSTLNTCLL